MKILIPVMQFGKTGGYRTLSRLATEWNSKGHEAFFVSSFATIKPYYPTTAKVIYVNELGDVVEQKEDAAMSLINKFIGVTKFLKRHSLEYDIVLANHNITAWAVKFGSRSTNCYYVQAYEPELISSRGMKGFVMRSIAKMSYHLGLNCIVNAEIYKNYKNLHSKFVVPPGMDLSLYYPKEKQWNAEKPITIGCIGRNEEWKGSGDVAKAIDLVRARGIDVRFRVAFNPVDCNDYELVKPDGDEKLSEYYRSVDVLVAPAKIQLGAIHYPVLEAMASGTTLITTGYYPANDSNSYIVPVSSPEKIADAIIDIINDREKALKKTYAAVNEIQRFDWNSVSLLMLNIFDEIVNGRT